MDSLECHARNVKFGLLRLSRVADLRDKDGRARGCICLLQCHARSDLDCLDCHARSEI